MEISQEYLVGIIIALVILVPAGAGLVQGTIDVTQFITIVSVVLAFIGTALFGIVGITKAYKMALTSLEKRVPG